MGGKVDYRRLQVVGKWMANSTLNPHAVVDQTMVSINERYQEIAHTAEKV